MKAKIFFLGIISVLFALSSCQDFTEELQAELLGRRYIPVDPVDPVDPDPDPDPDPVIEAGYFTGVNKDICFDYDAVKIAYKLESAMSYSLVSSPDWMSVNLNNTTHKLTLTIPKNTGGYHKGTVTIKGGSDNYSVLFYQLSKPTGYINGHAYVTLAGTKWSTCAAGASSPSGEGDYYGRYESFTSWGEGWRMCSEDDQTPANNTSITSNEVYMNNIKGRIWMSGSNAIFVRAQIYQVLGSNYDIMDESGRILDRYGANRIRPVVR